MRNPTSTPTPSDASPAPVATPPGGMVQQILRSDLPASLVVFLIAIPLSLGIAFASGAPVMAGLIAAVIGGVVGGALGGSPLQVSGPAAGLTVIVFGLVQKFGWPATCAITVAAGLMQIVFGALKIARGALAISPSVVHGMLAGIGVTIALAQLHVVLGGKPESRAVENIIELPDQIAHLHGGATFLGLLTIGLLMLWRVLPKAIQKVPGPLAAVTISTLVSVLFRFEVPRVQLPANLFADHVLPKMPAHDLWGAALGAAFTVALIASVESLLSAVAVDKMHGGPRADLDRELIGQGAANTVSGLLGGLPVTGVIVRSSANVHAGAQTRTSAILHGIWVLLFVALLGSLIQQIPLSVLAGLLVYVGVNLVKPSDIRELNHHREAPAYWATLLGVVGLNLLYGVGIGIALGGVLLLRRLAGLRVYTDAREDRHHVRIEGAATFLSVPQLSAALSTIPPRTNVDVDLRVDFMDHAAFEALHNWRAGQEKSGGRVDIDERHESWYSGTPTPKGGRVSPVNLLRSVLLGRRKQSATTPGTSPQSGTIVEGAREFQRDGAPLVRDLLADLARNGQHPSNLFITCSDSRLVPTIFTLSGPGDLFKIRNVGNLVPPQGADDTSVGAAIEYALGALNVPGIVVCGHSGCGAMKAALEGGHVDGLPHLNGWLTYARESRARFDKGETLDTSLAPADQLAQLNVVVQIENLMTYPQVRERYDAGQLTISGMFFDIENAHVYLLDREQRRFRPVTEAEAVAATRLPDTGALLSLM